MPPESPWRPCAPLALALFAGAVLLPGCALPPPAPQPVYPAVVAEPPPPAPPAPVPPPPPPAPPTDLQMADRAAGAMLAWADRVRALPVPELAQEISRLAEPGESPERQLQLALALLATRVPADGPRAQALLQRVLGNGTPAARPYQPLARQVAAQYAEQRRAEEQLERQAQQLRDSQRRIDQLNDRLEALRAMERSLPARPSP